MYSHYSELLQYGVPFKCYLMHEHQCPFMAIIDLFIARVCNTFSFDLFPSLSQIIVPQLIAVKKKSKAINKNVVQKNLPTFNLLLPVTIFT